MPKGLPFGFCIVIVIVFAYSCDFKVSFIFAIMSHS